MGPMGSNLLCFIYIGSVDFYDKCTVGKYNIHGSYGLMFSLFGQNYLLGGFTGSQCGLKLTRVFIIGVIYYPATTY